MRFALGVIALFAAAGSVQPASALTVEEAVNQYVAPMVGSVNLPGGVAVGVYHRGAIRYFNFGVADRNGRQVNERTIFEIGSVTKTFTAALLAEAANAGRINLTGSIVPYLPPSLTLQPAARAVTPLELATFTSGLPDDPPGLPRRIARRGLEYYTVADFFSFLSHWTPPGKLPAPYKYSNAGVGLLGFLIAGSIEGWERQVHEKITNPLAMTDTRVRLSDEQRQRLAKGFFRNGRPAPIWPVYAWAAAGALRSTAHDLVTYLAANLGHSGVNGSNAPETLIAAMATARKTYYQIRKGPDRQALTWRVRKHGDGPQEIVFKDGGTAGFSTFVGYNPAKDLGVVILANWHPAPVVRAGLNVIGHVNDRP